MIYCRNIPHSFLRPRDPSSILARTTFCVSSFTRDTSSAATAPQKHEWIVILPDHEGVLQKRMEIRPDHLKALHASIETGFWKIGGAILEEVIKEGEAPKIKGSIMLAFAESKKDVLKALQEDIYFKQGVWNWNKVQIHPFKCGFRQPI